MERLQLKRTAAALLFTILWITHCKTERLNFVPTNDVLFNYEVWSNNTMHDYLNFTEVYQNNIYDTLMNKRKKTPKFHQDILLGVLHNTTQIMKDLGMLNKCSSVQRRELYQEIDKSLKHILSSKDTNTKPYFWKEHSHPMHQLFQTIKNVQKNNKCFGESRYFELAKAKFKHHLKRLNPEVVEFLSNLIESSRTNFAEHKMNIREEDMLEVACESFIQVHESDVDKCMADLEFAMLQSHIIKETDGRVKRALEKNAKIDKMKRRQGFGSQPESNYIVMEQEADKQITKKDKAIISLLSTAAGGAFGIIGLIGFRILSALANGGGTPGDAGDKGMKGIPGDKGRIGNPGAAGQPGNKGVMGAQGMKGLKGVVGDQGLKGLKGNTGFKGLKGIPGDPGMPGNQGPNGPKGLKGVQGEKGIKGIPGDKGSLGRRKKRETRDIVIDIMDTNSLLNDLYRQKRKDRTTVRDIETAINELWQEKKRPVGCFDCTLFTALNDDNFTDLDRYILTTFSQLIGNKNSSQMLHDVLRGKQGSAKMTCARRGKTCVVEMFYI